MPRLKFRTLAAGPHGVYHPGQVHDIPQARAKALIEGGAAFAIDEAGNPAAPPPPLKPAETAAKKPDGTRQ